MGILQNQVKEHKTFKLTNNCKIRDKKKIVYNWELLCEFSGGARNSTLGGREKKMELKIRRG